MAFTATFTPNSHQPSLVRHTLKGTIHWEGNTGLLLTCLLVQRQINSPVAARTELSFEEVLVLDVASAGLDEPGAVERHDVGLAARREHVSSTGLNHVVSFD